MNDMCVNSMKVNDLDRAKKLLDDGDYTCAACCGEREYTSRERGVKPLLALIDNGRTLEGYSVADRVVGRAAAYLYVELKAQCVHAHIMSRAAQEVFSRYGVAHSADELVDAIINRAKTGLCPMESAVWDISDPHEAELAVRAKVRELAQKP